MRERRDVKFLIFFHEHVQRSASVVRRPEGECAGRANQKIASRKSIDVGNRGSGAGARAHTWEAKEIIHIFV